MTNATTSNVDSDARDSSLTLHRDAPTPTTQERSLTARDSPTPSGSSLEHLTSSSDPRKGKARQMNDHPDAVEQDASGPIDNLDDGETSRSRSPQSRANETTLSPDILPTTLSLDPSSAVTNLPAISPPTSPTTNTSIDRPALTPTIAVSRRRRRRNPWQRLKRFWKDNGTQLGISFRALFAFIQIVIILVLLSLSASRFHVGPDNVLTEWDTCKRLGVWSALWAARASLAILMNVWELRRYLDKRRRQPSALLDLETALQSPTSDRRPSNSDQLQVPSATGNRRASSVTYPPPRNGPPLQRESRVNQQTSLRDSRATVHGPQPPQRPNQLPYSATFDRFDTLLTVLAIVHFVVNHIFLYTSLQTCRFTTPHLWWLAFGIASLGYIIVLELLLIAFVVFILGPILLLFLNLLMLCLGRPVDRHGNVQIRPEIPRLEQKWIDGIPLVVYVPPPDSEEDDEDEDDARDASTTVASGAGVSSTVASTAQSPQKSAATSPAEQTHGRFANFLGFGGKSKKVEPSPKAGTPVHTPTTGDPRYEPVEHPLVVLDRNRATCPICLTDFVEPKRREGVKPAPPRKSISAPGDDPAAPAESDDSNGTPGEPLRMLACGHVFHMACLDPWLSTVSGRCPVCSRKVEAGDITKSPP